MAKDLHSQSTLAGQFQIKISEHIQSISSTLFTRAKSLVSDIEVDLNVPLSEKDE